MSLMQPRYQDSLEELDCASGREPRATVPDNWEGSDGGDGPIPHEHEGSRASIYQVNRHI